MGIRDSQFAAVFSTHAGYLIKIMVLYSIKNAQFLMKKLIDKEGCICYYCKSSHTEIELLDRSFYELRPDGQPGQLPKATSVALLIALRAQIL